MTMISGQNLTCIRGYTPIFRDLSFTVQPGETLLLTGANGSGKTTLLRMIAGLLPPSSGQITGAPPEDIFWSAQELPLKSTLTTRQNLEFPAKLHGVTIDSNQALSDVSLAQVADYPLHYLSSGQKRRVMLALLSHVKRKILLLDEPTNHLDSDGISLLQRLLKTHLEHGGCAIIATHAPEHFGAAKKLDVSQFSPKTEAA